MLRTLFLFLAVRVCLVGCLRSSRHVPLKVPNMGSGITTRSEMAVPAAAQTASSFKPPTLNAESHELLGYLHIIKPNTQGSFRLQVNLMKKYITENICAEQLRLITDSWREERDVYVFSRGAMLTALIESGLHEASKDYLAEMLDDKFDYPLLLTSIINLLELCVGNSENGHSRLVSMDAEDGVDRNDEAQYKVALEVYRKVRSSSVKLSYATDKFHELGLRAYAHLGRWERCINALNRISTAHRLTRDMMTLSLSLLERLEKDIDELLMIGGRRGSIADVVAQLEEYSDRIILSQPLSDMHLREPLLIKSLLRISASPQHLHVVEDVVSKAMHPRNPFDKGSLNPATSYALVATMLRHGTPIETLIDTFSITWREEMNEDQVHHAVYTVVESAYALRQGLSRNDKLAAYNDLNASQPDAATDRSDTRRIEMMQMFATSLIQVPEKLISVWVIDRNIEDLVDANMGDGASFYLLEKMRGLRDVRMAAPKVAMEVLVDTMMSAGLQEEAWKTLQLISDHEKGLYTEEERSHVRASDMWQPHAEVLEKLLANEEAVLSLTRLVRGGVSFDERLLASIFTHCIGREDYFPALYLWEALAEADTHYCRTGPVLAAAVRFAYSVDMKVGLLVSLSAIKGAVQYEKRTSASMGMWKVRPQETTSDVIARLAASDLTVPKPAEQEMSFAQTATNRGSQYTVHYAVDSLHLIYEVLASMPAGRGPVSVAQTLLLHLLRRHAIDDALAPLKPVDVHTLALGGLMSLRQQQWRDWRLKPRDAKAKDIPSRVPLRIPFSADSKVFGANTSTGLLETSAVMQSFNCGVEDYQRLFNYLEYCRLLIPNSLHTLFRVSEEWVRIILTTYHLGGRSEIALRAFDRYLGARRLSAEYTQTKPCHPGTLGLAIAMSADVIPNVKELVKDETAMQSEALRASIDDIYSRCNRYYGEAWASYKEDMGPVTLALLEIAHVLSNSTMAFAIAQVKIETKGSLSRLEVHKLTNTALHCRKINDLVSFWVEEYHKKPDLITRCTTNFALLESHLLAGNVTGFLHWTEMCLSAEMTLSPTYIEELLTVWYDAVIEQQKVSSGSAKNNRFDEVLRALAALNFENVDAFIGDLFQSSMSRRVASSNYLPVPMATLEKMASGLASSGHYIEAEAMLAYIHPSQWPYNALVISAIHTQQGVGPVAEILDQWRSILRKNAARVEKMDILTTGVLVDQFFEWSATDAGKKALLSELRGGKSFFVDLITSLIQDNDSEPSNSAVKLTRAAAAKELTTIGDAFSTDAGEKIIEIKSKISSIFSPSLSSSSSSSSSSWPSSLSTDKEKSDGKKMNSSGADIGETLSMPVWTSLLAQSDEYSTRTSPSHRYRQDYLSGIESFGRSVKVDPVASAAVRATILHEPKKAKKKSRKPARSEEIGAQEVPETPSVHTQKDDDTLADWQRTAVVTDDDTLADWQRTAVVTGEASESQTLDGLALNPTDGGTQRAWKDPESPENLAKFLADIKSLGKAKKLRPTKNSMLSDRTIDRLDDTDTDTQSPSTGSSKSLSPSHNHQNSDSDGGLHSDTVNRSKPRRRVRVRGSPKIWKKPLRRGDSPVSSVSTTDRNEELEAMLRRNNSQNTDSGSYGHSGEDI